ncbi:hypothetical protein FDG2_3369 [Candidatus Protofrankia californiensis]|uniref:Uncharacterized protein n=1 Tax=Candidatus Protofrankia californiensis TaxID=1839754 RepID=A0A1C3NZJ3_9ACTN|nr:hypothetical protein FDG2_3369 [Candidatus Protofrankia californiensis]
MRVGLDAEFIVATAEDVDDLPILVDRAVQVDSPAGTFTYVSSTNHRSSGMRRQGRTASISSGVNRCTHR